MKKILAIISLFICSFLFAQNNKTIQQNIDEANKSIQKLDSINNAAIRYSDSINAAKFIENNDRALNSFINERNAKAKKQAYLRIAMGIAFLGVVIFGLLRKNKKINRT